MAEAKETTKQILTAAAGRILRFLTAGFFEGDIQQEKNDQNQSGGNLNISADGPEIIHFSNFPSKLTVNNKKIVPKSKLYVKLKTSPVVLGRKMVSPIKVAPYQPADKFTESPESAFSHGLERLIGINLNLTGRFLFVK